MTLLCNELGCKSMCRPRSYSRDGIKYYVKCSKHVLETKYKILEKDSGL